MRRELGGGLTEFPELLFDVFWVGAGREAQIRIVVSSDVGFHHLVGVWSSEMRRLWPDMT